MSDITSTSNLDYPSSIGSPVIRRVNVGGWKTGIGVGLEDMVNARAQNLASQAKALQDYYNTSVRILRANIGFIPTPGHIYHLYAKPKEWLSLLGPSEWDRDDYIGSFRFDGSGWEEIK